MSSNRLTTSLLTAVCATMMFCNGLYASGKTDNMKVNDVPPTFKEFTALLPDWTQKDINDWTFGDTIIYDNPIINVEDYGKYLPSSMPGDVPEKMRVMWYAGNKVVRGDITIAFLQRCGENRGDSEYLSYYDFIVTTYSKDGEMIDSMTIGRKGSAWDAEVKGSVDNLKFTVQQEVLPDSSVLYDDNDSLVHIQRTYECSIKDDGKIIKKEVGKARTRIEVLYDESQHKVEFADYLALFYEWKKGDDPTKLTDPDINARKGYLKKPFIKAFIPKNMICKCRTKGLDFDPVWRIKLPSCHAVLMKKYCDDPAKEMSTDGCDVELSQNYMYGDDLLITYKDNGEIIDVQTLNRIGDMWNYTMDIDKDLNIRVRQGDIYGDINKEPVMAVVTGRLFQIEEDGTISRTVTEQPHKMIVSFDKKWHPTFIEPQNKE